MPDNTDVVILALGVDGFTTNTDNLRVLLELAPEVNFTLMIMVDRYFCPRLHNAREVDLDDPNGIDLFPPRAHGMRLRIFRLDDFVAGQTREVTELIALWNKIRQAKMSVNLCAILLRSWTLTISRPGNPNVHLRFTMWRNRFPVSPNGEWAEPGSLTARR